MCNTQQSGSERPGFSFTRTSSNEIYQNYRATGPDRETYQLVVDNGMDVITCSCSLNQSRKIDCRHIVALRKHINRSVTYAEVGGRLDDEEDQARSEGKRRHRNRGRRSEYGGYGYTFRPVGGHAHC